MVCHQLVCHQLACRQLVCRRWFTASWFATGRFFHFWATISWASNACTEFLVECEGVIITFYALSFASTFGHEAFCTFDDTSVFLTSDETVFDGSWLLAFSPFTFVTRNCWLVLGEGKCEKCKSQLHLDRFPH